MDYKQTIDLLSDRQYRDRKSKIKYESLWLELSKTPYTKPMYKNQCSTFDTKNINTY